MIPWARVVLRTTSTRPQVRTRQKHGHVTVSVTTTSTELFGRFTILRLFHSRRVAVEFRPGLVTISEFRLRGGTTRTEFRSGGGAATTEYRPGTTE